VARTIGRDRQRGITQAEVERVLRAAKEAAPGAVVEIDPISKRIRVLSGAQTAPDAGNPWDEVLTDAADTKRPA
jgi:hypothetical protein